MIQIVKQTKEAYMLLTTENSDILKFHNFCHFFSFSGILQLYA